MTLLVHRTNPRRRALAIRMRYMCTHARYYSTHNAHAHSKLMGWAKHATPSAIYFSYMFSSQASCVIVSAALDLDTYPPSNFIRRRCAERAKPSRGKPVFIMHIGFFACFHVIFLQRSRFSEIVTFFLALVELKLLLSLISRLVDCSARIVGDRQAGRQADTQNDYCNPRALRMRAAG